MLFVSMTNTLSPAVLRLILYCSTPPKSTFSTRELALFRLEPEREREREREREDSYASYDSGGSEGWFSDIVLSHNGYIIA